MSVNDTIPASVASLTELISCSVLFVVIVTVGVVGNILVIFIILSDRKMRQSVTNLFIINLAFSDLVFMTLGIPEIIMFMVNRGWLFGLEMCKIQRYVIVSAFYGSVLTLVSVSIERYIAIVYPIKAHLLCARGRTVIVILMIWAMATVSALPVALFNTLVEHNATASYLCMLRFPYKPQMSYLVQKYVEFIIFYAGPLIIQVCCYVVIGRRLSTGADALLTNKHLRRSPGREHDDSVNSGAIGARTSVIKMLVACVTVYFVSYSPHQVLLFYNTFSPTPFHETWGMYVFVTICANICSAANPVIYCIFSGNFRRRFHGLLCMSRYRDTEATRQTPVHSSQCTEYITMTRLQNRSSPVSL